MKLTIVAVTVALLLAGCSTAHATATNDPALVNHPATPSPGFTDIPLETYAPAAPAAPPELTLAQQNAVAKAQSYLALTAFSRSGLIEQLKYDGFAEADATAAVDMIAPDWNAQAAAKAKEYLKLTAFSRSGLIDQLVYDGFTQEQAQAGATAAGY